MTWGILGVPGCSLKRWLFLSFNEYTCTFAFLSRCARYSTKPKKAGAGPGRPPARRFLMGLINSGPGFAPVNSRLFKKNQPRFRLARVQKTAPGRPGPGRPVKISKKCIPGAGPEKIKNIFSDFSKIQKIQKNIFHAKKIHVQKNHNNDFSDF